MADVKVLVGEIDGVEFGGPVEYVLQSEDVPFDNSSNGFTADNVQGAIEEAAGSGGSVTPPYLIAVVCKTSGSCLVYTKAQIIVDSSLCFTKMGSC
jgi:hypothetical protein